MHHSCQEDFAQFGTTFHYLQKEKKIMKAYPKKITTLLSLCKCNINEKNIIVTPTKWLFPKLANDSCLSTDEAEKAFNKTMVIQ